MILVVGGTGLLGRLVVHEMCERDQPVRVLSRGLTDRGPVDPRAELVLGDVRNPASLIDAMAGVNTVVSCVQGFSGPGGVTPRTVDAQGNMDLVDAAQTAGADVVLVSMIGAAADSPMELARAKFAAEEHLRASGAPWTVVRADAFVQAWVRVMEETAGRSGRPMVFGRGDNPIAWVDAREVAQLVARAAQDRTLRGQVLDVCGPQAITLTALAQGVMDRRGVAGRPRRVPRAALHVMSRTVGLVLPAMGRQARAALAMDVLPTSHDAASRALFPDLPRTAVTDVLDDVVGPVARSAA